MRRVALKRRVSLSDSFRKKLKREGEKIIYKPRGVVLKRRPLKKVAKSRRRALSAYYALTEAFLKLPQNRSCEICTRRRESGEDVLIQSATEVHHWAGRIGRLLCYVPYFRSSCYGCRLWPHQHPAKARELNLLAPAALWNVFPE